MPAPAIDAMRVTTVRAWYQRLDHLELQAAIDPVLMWQQDTHDFCSACATMVRPTALSHANA